MKRRELLRSAAGLAVLAARPGRGNGAPAETTPSTHRMVEVDSEFEREPLLRPFGFKGGYMSEIWQTAVLAVGSAGGRHIGLGTQNVLWSDAAVFAGHSESGGNALMYAVTEHALQLAKGRSFASPVDLLDELLPEAHAYACAVSGRRDLRTTFTLNALVPVDNAAWLLYASQTGSRTSTP